LVGSVGAPCHEDRARGAKDTIAKYGDMEIVATEYDMDSVDMAYDLTLHDVEALRYLHDGVIYCLGVQDCYSIGYDTIQVAVKIADGNLPGELFPEKTDEITTVIYQEMRP
nr:sugar ABC transporter substrate-binding protein [Lachnospiraceae bacterium]